MVVLHLFRRTAGGHLALLFQPLLQVHLGVPLLLVAPRELAAAHVAREGLLPRMRPDVRRQMIGARERAHTDAALKRFLTRVYPDVSGKFVGSREPPIAIFDRARVRPLVHGRLARPVRVFPRFNRN